MTKPDEAFERAADKLDEAAEKAEDQGGLVAKLAPPLEEDADFLRTIEPSKVKARIKGEEVPGEEEGVTLRAQPVRTRSPAAQDADGPSRAKQLAPALGALFAGILLAKLVYWRSLVEPRH